MSPRSACRFAMLYFAKLENPETFKVETNVEEEEKKRVEEVGCGGLEWQCECDVQGNDPLWNAAWLAQINDLLERLLAPLPLCSAGPPLVPLPCRSATRSGWGSGPRSRKTCHCSRSRKGRSTHTVASACCTCIRRTSPGTRDRTGTCQVCRSGAPWCAPLCGGGECSPADVSSREAAARRTRRCSRRRTCIA